MVEERKNLDFVQLLNALHDERGNGISLIAFRPVANSERNIACYFAPFHTYTALAQFAFRRIFVNGQALSPEEFNPTDLIARYQVSLHEDLVHDSGSSEFEFTKAIDLHEQLYQVCYSKNPDFRFVDEPVAGSAAGIGIVIRIFVAEDYQPNRPAEMQLIKQFQEWAEKAYHEERTRKPSMWTRIIVKARAADKE
jgi:hypothetical protein